MVAALLAEEYEPGAIVPGDAFFGFLRRGYVDPWLQSAHPQNTAVIAAAAAAAGRLSSTSTVVYDGVVGRWFLRNFLGQAQVHGLQYAVLLPPLPVCFERVRTRTGHGFNDPEATRQMHREFTAAERDERHIFPTDVSDAAEQAQEIRRCVLTGSLWVEA